MNVPMSGYLQADIVAPPPTRNRRPLVIAGVIAVVVMLIGGASVALIQFSHRTTVALTVVLQAPNGGVFADASGCTLREEFGLLDDPGNLRVVDFDGPTLKFNPQWQLDGQNTCVARELVKLDKTHRYYVSLGSGRLGDLTVVDLEQGEARLLRTISVTRDLSGTLAIGQKASSCRGSINSWRCTWYTASFSLELDEDSGRCSGTGGYSDLSEGMNVTVYDSAGRVAGSGAITDSVYDLESMKTKVILCKLSWSIDGIPNDDKGYSVEVGDRGKVYFDAQELVMNDWVADTHLGD